MTPRSCIARSPRGPLRHRSHMTPFRPLISLGSLPFRQYAYTYIWTRYSRMKMCSIQHGPLYITCPVNFSSLRRTQWRVLQLTHAMAKSPLCGTTQHYTVPCKIIKVAVLLLPASQLTLGSRNVKRYQVMMAAKVE